MRLRAKTGLLVGYNSRNIYRILLLAEEMVIRTRDVIFDETLFLHNTIYLSPNDEAIPVIDFKMITVIPDYVLDISDYPIRNNELDSQILEDELEEIDIEISRNDLGILTPEDSLLSNCDNDNTSGSIPVSENYGGKLLTPSLQNIDIYKKMVLTIVISANPT